MFRRTITYLRESAEDASTTARLMAGLTDELIQAERERGDGWSQMPAKLSQVVELAKAWRHPITTMVMIFTVYTRRMAIDEARHAFATRVLGAKKSPIPHKVVRGLEVLSSDAGATFEYDGRANQWCIRFPTTPPLEVYAKRLDQALALVADAVDEAHFVEDSDDDVLH